MKIKLKKNKIIWSIILIVLVVIILVVYNAFMGNPISKAIERKKLQSYVEKTYSGTDFKVDKVYFNFKFGEYGANVVSEEKGYNFNIVRLNDGSISDEYKNMPMLIDYQITRRFMDSITDDINKALKDKLNLSIDGDEYDANKSSLYVLMNIEQGKYRDRNIEYSNDLNDKFAIGISVPAVDEKEYRAKLSEIMNLMRDFALKQNYEGLIGIYVNTTTFNGDAYCLVLNEEDLKVDSENLKDFIYTGFASYDNLNKDAEIEVEGYDEKTKQKEIDDFEKSLEN